MNAKSITLYLAVLTILLSLVLAACATPGAPAADQTPPPATEIPQEVVVTDAAGEPDEPVELRRIAIDHVQVEMGEGSPLPVEVVASGTWPDLCAQVALVEQHFAGSTIIIDVFATPVQTDCPPDQAGIAFRIAIPLNVAELPAGTYGVSVNGVETGFAWDFVSSAENTPGTAQDGTLQSLSIDAVAVEVGVGSPIPVEVVTSGSWPELCAQLASVEQKIAGQQIEISLFATPSNPDCPADQVGIPFRVAVPLNMVEIPFGEYQVVVNGIETTFDWTGSPAVVEEPSTAPVVAYIGLDGNVWVVGGSDSQPRQITRDAIPLSAEYDPNAPTLSYYFPAISSDGRYVAVRKDEGTPTGSGLQYLFELQAIDTQTGETRLAAAGENPPAGADWQPGTHLLAYGMGTDPAYFTNRGAVDANLATGIFGWEAGSGETKVLVEPQRGYALMLPTWSPDGRFLSFDEILYMEGRQPFAYYDFAADEYYPHDAPLGFYDWSPDGNQIAYDYLTYTATGEERIYIREREAGGEVQVSPDYEAGGYAFFPVYSPDGSRLAYFANLNDPETNFYTLFILELAGLDQDGGEPMDLGTFESVNNPQWSPDGKQLIFSAGPWEIQQVLAVNTTDGNIKVLGEGNQPSVAQP